METRAAAWLEMDALRGRSFRRKSENVVRTRVRHSSRPLTGKAKRHDLLVALTIALATLRCAPERCLDLADFAIDREGLFSEFLRLENCAPSHGAFSHTFRPSDLAAVAT